MLRRAGAVVRELGDNPVTRRSWQSSRDAFNLRVERLARLEDSFHVVQVGACDGTTADPIHNWIVQYGWSGLLIEPQLGVFERLTDTYAQHPGIQLANVAIDSKSGKRTLYKLPVDDHTEALSMLTASFRTDTSLGSRENLDEEIVQVATFEDVFEKFDISQVDFLQIDVEGFDAEILALFNFELFRPLIVHYEHRHLSHSERKSSEALLRSFGYEVSRMRYDTGAFRDRVSPPTL